MPSYWFTYDGSGSITDAMNFDKVNSQPNCPGSTNLCAIFATAQTLGGVIRPIITGTSLETDIPVAVQQSQETLTILLRT